MTTQLYLAIALCIGLPGDQGLPTMNGVSLGACDYGMRVEGGYGFLETECEKQLSMIHDKGNIVKFCIPKDADIINFHVEWAKP